MARCGKNPEPAAFPCGYYMRSYISANKKEDGEGWCGCCAGGSLGIEEISEAAFENKMLCDKSVNPENIFFLIAPNGCIAGTVTYQYTGAEDTGCIHMVAVAQEYQGKKLALPMVLYAVQKITGDGKTKIILSTDDWRIPAIKTYLKAGFEPAIKPGDEETAARWANVMAKTSEKS